MKIDKEYMKSLLEAFESAESPFTNIEELEERGFPYEDNQFAFHMDILLDKAFIESKSTRGGVGYILLGDGSLGWSAVPLRLTATGHDFLAAIRQPDVWEKLTTSFKEASLETMKIVALDLAKGFARKKVKQLIGEQA